MQNKSPWPIFYRSKHYSRASIYGEKRNKLHAARQNSRRSGDEFYHVILMRNSVKDIENRRKVVDRHGLGTMNKNEELLTDSRLNQNLVIGGQMFKHHNIHKKL